MTMSFDDYNRQVAEAQFGAGCFETAEPLGSRLRPGDWSVQQ
jgi:hypothetical protein